MFSALGLASDQLPALNVLMFGQASLLTHCTACGARLPVPPLPECARYRHEAIPFEGIWQCGDATTGRGIAVAFAACHAHACHVSRETLWAEMEAKLRARYGFVDEEAGDGQC
jgi:hypothetical protein